jgi:DNA/RNA endonuclease YhcR with UshA esterase domain
MVFKARLMNESLLLKAALITAILGIIALIVIIKATGIKEININQAKESEEGATIRITGIVERVTSKEGFSIISIKKEETISVVLFDNINLSKGQKVEITGKVQDYQGSKELVADKIVVKG